MPYRPNDDDDDDDDDDDIAWDTMTARVTRWRYG